MNTETRRTQRRAEVGKIGRAELLLRWRWSTTALPNLAARLQAVQIQRPGVLQPILLSCISRPQFSSANNVIWGIQLVAGLGSQFRVSPLSVPLCGIRGQRKSPAAPLPGLLSCGVACFAGWQLWNSIFGISRVSFQLHFVLGSPVTGLIICPPPAGFRLPFPAQPVDFQPQTTSRPSSPLSPQPSTFNHLKNRSKKVEKKVDTSLLFCDICTTHGNNKT